MNLQEAYSILEIPQGTSPEDAKKKYRELTKKYHPDVNKDPDAEAKFKKINEAYNVIQKGEEPQHQFHGDHFVQRRKPRPNPEIVHLHAHISYKDSIFGCKRDFVYDRRNKCDECNGQGVYSLHNGCTECKGQGVVITRQGNMIMQQTCGKCRGKIPTEECKPCNGTGGVKATRTITVTVPGGVVDGNILRLEGMGNFVEVVNNFFNSGDAYTDAFVQLHIQPAEFKCTIKDNNLHVPLDITLLEALRGCTKNIKTLDGIKEIKIPQKTKNGHQVIIPNLGVSRTGNQIIDINVDYPQDIDSLISHLVSKEN